MKKKTKGETTMTHGDYDLARGNVAREEWILAYMQDVPAPYRALLPPAFDATELRDAEKAIRRMIERDAKAYLEEPFRAVGPEPRMVDWSEMGGTEAFAFSVPLVGMSKAVRRGFENHPAVLAAYEQAQQTPEFKRCAERRTLSIAFTTARDLFTKASYVGQGVEAGEPVGDEAMVELEAAYLAAKRALNLFDGIDVDASAE